MKCIDNEEMTISTKRTLKGLRQALTDLLKIKPLDKIAIQELCDLAMISRGTFYNYFYDKYDLLNYDWSQVQLLIDPVFTHPDLNANEYERYIDLFLKNLITYLSNERETYRMIINHNSNNIFSVNMHEYIGEQIFLRLNEATEGIDKTKIPLELLSKVYASTIITIGNWWLQSGDGHTTDEVYKFFNMLTKHNLVFD